MLPGENSLIKGEADKIWWEQIEIGEMITYTRCGRRTAAPTDLATA